MSKASDRERTESADKLREWVKPGDTVYTILRHVIRLAHAGPDHLSHQVVRVKVHRPPISRRPRNEAMRRRRKWRPPNNPTGPARQVWAALFPGEPWPAGWRVAWAGFMRGAAGLCLYSERKILLSYGDAKSGRCAGGVLGTLCHEFVHVRCRGLRHGKEFSALEEALLRRLGLVGPDEPTV